jgi:hypothetical protein
MPTEGISRIVQFGFGGSPGPTGGAGPAGATGATGAAGQGALGYTDIALTGASSTVSSPNWVNTSIRFTGTLTETHVVTVPTASASGQMHILWNATNKNLQVWTGTGTKLVIKPNEKQPYFQDAAVLRSPNPGYKRTVDVREFGVTGSTGDLPPFGGVDQDAGIRAALASALAGIGSGGPCELFFPGLPTDGGGTQHAVYWVNKPLRCKQQYFTIRGGGRDRTLIRGANFLGPVLNLGPDQDPSGSLVTNLVPPAAGNPTGNAWWLNDGTVSAQSQPTYPWYDIRQSGACEVNGLTKIAIEFFFRLDETVGISDTFAILGSAGKRFGDDDPVTGYASAFDFLVTGTGGTDNVLQASLSTTAGRVTLGGVGSALVVGTTYHVALTYDSTEGTPTVRLFVTPISDPTGNLAASQTTTGTVVQKGFEGCQIGNIPNGSLGQIRLYTGVNGVMDALRISKVVRYAAAGFTTPTTKWDTVTAQDTNTIFFLNFDTVEDDMMVGRTGQLFPCYMPTVGRVDLQDPALASFPGMGVKDLSVGGTGTAHDGLVGSSGIFMQLCTDSYIENCDCEGFYGYLVFNNCYNSVFKRLTGGGRYFGFADVGAGNSNEYSDFKMGGGVFACVALIGGSPVTFRNAYLIEWGPGGVGLHIETAFACLDTITCSAEALSEVHDGAARFGGLGCSIVANNCIFDGSYRDDPPSNELHAVDPVTICGGTAYTFINCWFGLSILNLNSPPYPDQVIKILNSDTFAVSQDVILKNCQIPVDFPLSLDTATSFIVEPRTIYGSKAVTITDANYTVTPDEWTYRTLVVGGTLTAARNLVVPSLGNRERIVRNNAAHILTVKTAAGTGVDVYPGGAALVRSDGTNIVSLFDTVPSISNTVFDWASFARAIKLTSTTTATTADTVIGTFDLASGSAYDVIVRIRGREGTAASYATTVSQLFRWNGSAFAEVGTADGEESGDIGSSVTPKLTVSGTTISVKVTPPSANSTSWVASVEWAKV